MFLYDTTISNVRQGVLSYDDSEDLAAVPDKDPASRPGGAAGAGPGALGLSLSHISPDAVSESLSSGNRGSWEYEVDDVGAPELQIAVGGEYVRLKGSPVAVGPGGVRGSVTGFSSASRKRLMELLAKLDKSKVERPLFVTLTYPPVWEHWGAADWKKHLDTFCKRLEREYPGVALVWKLEFQARGAPHYHLMIFNVPFLPYQWVASAWFDVVGSGDSRHLAAGVEVRKARSWNGVKAYAAKYMSKEMPGAAVEGVGRYWGVRGRKYLPIEIIVVALEMPQFFRIRRILQRWMKKQGYTWRSLAHNRYTGLQVFIDWLAGLKLLSIFE